MNINLKEKVICFVKFSIFVRMLEKKIHSTHLKKF